MEDMVPELEDLEERGYFSKLEVKQIVKKRTQFEYLLKRPAAVKTDFLRYFSSTHVGDAESAISAAKINHKVAQSLLVWHCRYAEYETKLEALRAHRKEVLGLHGKTTLADYAIVKRTHLIYERATRKFRGDLRVWLIWLHFCRTSGSTRQISRVHPPETWLRHWSMQTPFCMQAPLSHLHIGCQSTCCQ